VDICRVFDERREKEKRWGRGRKKGGLMELGRGEEALKLGLFWGRRFLCKRFGPRDRGS